MSLGSRREYLDVVRERYRGARTRAEKGRIIDEVVGTLGYHRKHAIRVLAGRPAAARPGGPAVGACGAPRPVGGL